MRAERTTNRAGAPPRSMTKPGPPPGAAIAAGDIGTARGRSGDGARTVKVIETPPQVPPIRSAEKQIHCYRHGGSFNMHPHGQFETSVDAGSNETALKRVEPGRVRVRSLAARGLAAVLLAAFAALLALPLQAQAQTIVPNDWSLIPTGLVAGDKFRLIFLSSTKTTATSDDIADYNSFIQNLAAAGHTDIQTYSAGFRAVGCTADSDATANTGTTGTGVVIYWLNGNKAADNYGDFYDGSWDDEANDKNEAGNNGRDTTMAGNYPRTGCEHNGTEATFGSSSRALGASAVRVGIPNSSVTNEGPLSSATNPSPSDTRPMYGLSQVFEVAAAGNTLATGKPSITGAAQAGMTLTAGLGDIADTDGLPASGYTYQWIREGSDLLGVTGSSLTLSSNFDYGQKLRVRVSFTDGAGFLESRTSDETLPVAPAAAFCPSDAATVWCATLTVGHETEEYLGEIDVLQSGYEARSGRTAFGSVTGTTFRHLGIDYTVTAVWGGGQQTLTLATTPNLPSDGAGLTAHVQTYGGEVDAPVADALFVSGFQHWQFVQVLFVAPGGALSDVPLLRGAFSRGARVGTPPDFGTKVRVRLSRVVATGPATGAPEISGTIEVGETLTADTSRIADGDGLTNVSYTYQWVRVDGSNETNIAGATESTYTLVAADEGKGIRVRVSFGDDAGNSETLASDVYRAVTLLPAPRLPLDDDPNAIWMATLTVANLDSNHYGYDASQGGGLTDTAFTYLGDDTPFSGGNYQEVGTLYTIDELFLPHLRQSDPALARRRVRGR